MNCGSVERIPRGAHRGVDLTLVALYSLYEDECQQLLRDRGLRALLKGGILWRLAMSMMNIPYTQFGPLSVPDSGWCGQLQDDLYLAGEELSQRDADILVGMYRVFNGKNPLAVYK